MATADEIRASASDTFNSIRNNPTISPSYRNNLLAKAYLAAKASMDALNTENQQASEKVVSDLQYSLFGFSGGDAIAYRDAQDKAAEIPDERTASAQMQTALENRDYQIAKAIADQSIRNGWADPTLRYIAANPNLQPKIDQLYNLRQESIFSFARSGRSTAGAALGSWAATYIPQPPEIANLPDYTLQVMAARGDADTAAMSN